MLAHASVRILTDMFPAAMFLPDPVSGLLPIQQALLNVGDDGSFENIDAVDAASSRRSFFCPDVSRSLLRASGCTAVAII